MKKVFVLGAGMVGRAIATDMATRYQVISADISSDALAMLAGKRGISTRILDVTDHSALSTAVKDSDIVISAVPGYLGMQTMTEVIKQGKDLVDISFMPEDVLHLDSLAMEHNVTVIMDCGVAPGIPNFITGYYNEVMHISEMEYMVGGLPKIRTFPFEYKAPFSPCDVIEEYLRPARCVENGKVIVRPAMSEPEYVYFNETGTLEAFNTDGLRSLIYTMKHIPFMKEKTLRYPGHIGLIKALKAAGFLDIEPVSVSNVMIKPLDFTSEILFKAWKPDPEDPEFTIMNVVLRGEEKGVRKEICYRLYDEYDPGEKLSSMARTTGFTATAAAEMIMGGLFNKKGLFPPELAGSDAECFNFILRYLKERNVNFTISEKNI